MDFKSNTQVLSDATLRRDAFLFSPKSALNIARVTRSPKALIVLKGAEMVSFVSSV